MRMALLASCWLLVETFILPNGFVKMFFLSFYINPFFLFFCQILLWLKKFQNFIRYLFGISYFLSSLLILYIKRVVFILVPLSTHTKLEVFYEVMDHDIRWINGAIIVKSTCMSISKPKTGDSRVSTWHDSSQKIEGKDGHEEFKNSWLNEYLTSYHYNTTPFSNEPDMNSDRSQSSSLSSSFMDQEFQCEMESFDDKAIDIPQSKEGIISRSEDVANNSMDLLPQSAEIHPTSSASPTRSMKSINDFVLSDVLNSSSINEELTRGVEDFEINSLTGDAEVDYEYPLEVRPSDSSILSFEQVLVSVSFHHKYAQRMRFFDVLYQERLYGINAICNADLASPVSMTSIVSQNSIEVQTNMLLKSLKSDLELVYTAEACLTWEALHYQYRKVETLARCDSSQRCRRFCTNVSENFRKFQISFDRFLEDQRLSDGISNLSHTYRRCQLRVPIVTEYMEDENCDLRKGEALEAIEKCIKSFWTYVKCKTDCKKFSRKLKATLWSYPTVEDPKDLHLLYDIIKALQKKEQVVKDLQKKKQSLLKRRVKPVQAESESIDVLCCAVDLKLVKKVLKMPVVSTTHLKWCQEKLNNIELRDGQLCRGTGAYLFPFS